MSISSSYFCSDVTCEQRFKRLKSHCIYVAVIILMPWTIDRGQQYIIKLKASTSTSQLKKCSFLSFFWAEVHVGYVILCTCIAQICHYLPYPTPSNIFTSPLHTPWVLETRMCSYIKGVILRRPFKATLSHSDSLLYIPFECLETRTGRAVQGVSSPNLLTPSAFYLCMNTSDRFALVSYTDFSYLIPPFSPWVGKNVHLGTCRNIYSSASFLSLSLSPPSPLHDILIALKWSFVNIWS